MKKLMFGYEVAVQAAIDAGAESMFGYPITPTCEILSGWANSGKKCLQTEDEIAAGFEVCGAAMAGEKSFTASAGPGHILLQDSFSMAEAMRLPAVLIAGQRGGPSSGTVIYSQQEVMLACFGGNGEGMRLVYSPSSVIELYQLIRRAFNESWQYRYPAVVLTDGYVLKTRQPVDLSVFKDIKNIPPANLVPEGKNIHWPNIYTSEEELNTILEQNKKDYDNISGEVESFENYKTEDAEILLIAHGIIGAVAKMAVEELRQKGIKAGLFRPITLRPFPRKELNNVCCWKCIKRVVVVESSFGQLARLVHEQLAQEVSVSLSYFQRPGLGIESDEVVEFVKKLEI